MRFKETKIPRWEGPTLQRQTEAMQLHFPWEQLMILGVDFGRRNRLGPSRGPLQQS